MRAGLRQQGDRCPFCHEETSELSGVTLRCSDCEAGYHLGCVAEASPRRCGLCGGQVVDERAGGGIVRREWRSAVQPSSWRRLLARAALVLALFAISFGIVYADARYQLGLTSIYFVSLIVILSGCVLFNLRDRRWELHLKERDRGPLQVTRGGKTLKR